MKEMNKILSMIGLATRAGKTVSGEFSVEKAVKQKKAQLVIVSEEASDNTKKLFSNKCSYYKVPYFVYGTKEELGMAVGNGARASIALIDSGFSKTVADMLTGIK